MPYVGDDVHDRAAVGFHPVIIDLAHEDEAAGQIVAHNCLEPLGGDRLQRRAKLTPGVVDEAIDAPVPREHRIDGTNHHGLVADVAGQARCLPAILLDLSLHLGELLHRPAHDRHVGAECSELMDRAAPDPAATASHNDGLPLEQIRPEHGLVWHCRLPDVASSPAVAPSPAHRCRSRRRALRPIIVHYITICHQGQCTMGAHP